MGKAIDTGLCYEFVAQEFPGTQLQVYAAQIQGPDPNYVFKRRFLELWSYKVENGLECEADLNECGIYEFSIRWLAAGKSSEDQHRVRWWGLVYDGAFYPIPREDVMVVWHWLQEYLRPLFPGGDGG